MSEFDFDELDQAVTQAMGSSKKVAEVPDPQPVVDDTNPTQSSSDVAVRIIKHEPVKPNPAPNPRTGRSMDIMRPNRAEQLAGKAEDLAVTEATEIADFEQAEDKLETSPFLPDANQKVEKTPLGEMKATDDDVSENSDSTTEELANIDSTADLNPEVTPVAGAAPDEILAGLNNDVEQLAPVASQVVSVPPKESTYVPEVQPTITENQDTPKSAGTIYDTENYHKSPQASAKKSSPLMIVMWVVIILLVVAVGAWALWTYVLSNFLVL